MAPALSSNHHSTSSKTLTTSLEKKRSLSPESTETVREVGIEDYEKAAECLSQAFAVDEVARYFLDTDDMVGVSEEEKYKLHCDIIRYMTAAHCLKGIVTTIGDDFGAVALWYVIFFRFPVLISEFCFAFGVGRRIVLWKESERKEGYVLLCPLPTYPSTPSPYVSP